METNFLCIVRNAMYINERPLYHYDGIKTKQNMNIPFEYNILNGIVNFTIF